MNYPVDTGCAIGVSRKIGPDVWVTHGLTPNGEPFTPNSMVYVGSLAKQVVGACAALLVQAGQLDINDRITKWLDELPRCADDILVRHLIHHTAGFPDETSVWNEVTLSGVQDRTSSSILEALSRLLKSPIFPGERYEYSNSGYVCLAAIVERVSQENLPAFAERHFFKPMEMSNTQLWAGPSPKPSQGIALEGSLSPAPLSLGDGGLWTTIHDLLRWSDGLNFGLIAISKLLHTKGQLDDGTPLDYAWGVRVFEKDGQQIQSHGGSWEGSTAKLVRLPALGLSIAAVSLHDDAERIVTLTDNVLQDVLSL